MAATTTESVRPGPAPAAAPPDRRPAGAAPAAALVFAGASAAAGIVHLAMTPGHVAEWATEGRSFAVVGLAQLAVAALAIGRARRWVFVAGAVLNGAAAAAWAWSRLWGLPFGPAAGDADPVGGLDALTAAAEVLAVVAAVVVVLAVDRRGVAASAAVASAGRFGGTGFPLGSVAGRGPVAAAVVAVALVAGAAGVVASPLGQHSHGGDDHHAAGADDHHATGEEAAGHDHVDTAVIPERPLDAATRDELAAQLTRVRELALAHPTVADAEADGYLRAVPFAPGAGAHYVNRSYGQAQAFDLEAPLAYLYAGTDPDSPVVGVMYFTLTAAPPEGFAGPLDVWHEHSGVCLTYGPDGAIDVPLPPDADVTEEACAEFDGEFLDITGQMVHAWVVPGWDSPMGVFSHDNPIVTCADGRTELGEDLYLGCPGI